MIQRMDELSKFAENRKDKTVLTGQSALAANGLIAGYFIFVIQTDIKNLNGVSLGNIVFEYYHLWDMNNYLNEREKGVYVPTPERAIIDCMVWQDENRDEGFLIEALQTYQEKHKVSDLYECADHYLVPHEVVDYWWKEAEEEDDMSMG